MSGIEKTAKTRDRTRKLNALILGSVALAGGLAVLLVAPNVLYAMDKLGMVPRKRQSEYIATARKRLKRQGLLVERDGRLSITEKGIAVLRSLSSSLMRKRSPKHWDKKWRMLVFDIAEKRRPARVRLRRELHSAGFIQVQKSVWLYPYPCEEFVALLKADLRIGRDVLYLIIDAMEGDAPYRAHFGLPTVNDEPIYVPAALDKLLGAILPKTR